jgi:urea carboxylase system permease
MTVLDEPHAHQDSDRDELAATFGYEQKLHRSLGSFSSFAAGYSYLSILTGTFELFYFGFGFGGPAFWWTFVFAFVGQTIVALNFAELSGHYPLAGSVYNWTKHISRPSMSWMSGWLMMATCLISVPAVALALQIILPQIWSGFQIIGNGTSGHSYAENAVLLGTILIVCTTVLNMAGVRAMAVVNNIGVFTELIGVSLLTVLLAVHAVRGPGVVFKGNGTGSGYGDGWLGAGLIAVLMGAYLFYGFDTAGSMAEETVNPRKCGPRAIIRSILAAGIVGCLMLLFALMAVGNIKASQLSLSTGGLPWLIKSTLGTGLGDVFLVAALLAVFVCTLACHTATIRMIFAMSRDGRMPFGRVLAHVSPKSQTPVVPAVVVGVLAIAILVINIDSTAIVTVVTSVAIITCYLAYIACTGPLLLRRLKGWPGAGGSNVGGLFKLGRWGLPLNVVAVVYQVVMIVNIAWPRRAIYNFSAPFHWYLKWGGVLFPLAVALLGGIYYVSVGRHKSVLAEHAAPIVTIPEPAAAPAAVIPTTPATGL